MFRVMDLREGRIDLSEGSERVAPPPAGVLRWIDAGSTEAPALELLRNRFEFHPLTIEDCSHLDQRPKLEEYRDHLFLVTQGFAEAEGRVQEDEPELQELHAFLSGAYLVTVHQGAIAALDEVWHRLAAEPRLLER